MSRIYTMVYATDFGATLDLRAAEADNCSVDNHAVMYILFALCDWRRVQYQKDNG